MITRIFALLTTILIVGCASTSESNHIAPTPEDFPAQTQPAMQAVRDWRTQADLLATDIVATMSQDPLLWPAPIYVYTARNSSQFERALVRMLSAQLVNNGMTVVSKPGSGFPLFVEARLIGFAEGRVADPAPAPQNGEKRSEERISVPRSEVLITVSLIKDNRYLFQNTTVLYARDEDHLLYMTPKPKVSESKKEQRLIDVVREYDAKRSPLNE